MNEVMALEPPMDVTDVKELKTQITQEMGDIYAEDAFSDEAWQTLIQLGCQVAIDNHTKEEVVDNEESDDFEPYTEAELFKFTVDGLKLICSDFGVTTQVTDKEELIRIIFKAQNEYLVSKGMKPTVEEQTIAPEYVQQETEKEYPDGTKKRARNGDTLYAGYTKKELGLMHTLTLKKLLKERFNYIADLSCTKEELIEYAMNLPYVPRVATEQEVDYLHATKKVDSLEGKVAKFTRVRTREECFVEALSKEDEDVEHAITHATELYILSGGKQEEGDYYMRNAANNVFKVACLCTPETLEQAKRFRPEFKMKAYKKGE